MDPVSARLLNQQLICPRFTSPHDGWGLCSGDLYALVEKKLTFYRHRDSRTRGFRSDTGNSLSNSKVPRRIQPATHYAFEPPNA